MQRSAPCSTDGHPGTGFVWDSGSSASSRRCKRFSGHDTRCTRGAGPRHRHRRDVRSALWYGRDAALLAGVDLRLNLLRGVHFDHRLSHEERPGAARASHARWADVRKGRHAADHHGVRSLGFIALLVGPALDHRFGWSAVPVWGVVLGDVFVVVGFYFIFLVYRENTFTAATIEVVAGQQVITTGPYAV